MCAYMCIVFILPYWESVVEKGAYVHVWELFVMCIHVYVCPCG